MTQKKMIALTWLLLFAVGTLYGQRTRLRFARLSIEEGLAQSSVRCVYQDRAGYIWLGTRNGLNRFDGFTFHHYGYDLDDPQSLPDNRITALAEDLDGNLWVGTQNGLARLVYRNSNLRTFDRFRHDPKDPTSLADNQVRALLCDRNGVLWVGTSAGLSRFDPAEGNFRHLKREPGAALGLTNGTVTALYEDKAGELWIGTAGGGLNRLDASRERLSAFRNWERRSVPRHDEAMDEILDLLVDQEPLVSHHEVQPEGQSTRTWTLTRNQTVVIVSTGSGRGNLTAYGEILRGNQVIWRMGGGRVRHAGGHIKNRLQVDVLGLTAGDYTLRWVDDGSHGPDAWDEKPPDRPALWGLNLFALNEEQTEQVTLSLDDYRIPSQIAGNLITALHEDDLGRLWVGTADEGLSLLSEDRGDFRTVSKPRAGEDVTYATSFLAQVDALTRGREPLATLTEIGDEAEERADFEIAQNTEVLLVYQGERRGGILVDHAWLEGPDGPMWFPTAPETTHAGGGRENRLQCTVISLAPGKYRLRFRSNEIYSYDNFAGKEPARPEWWGIQAIPLSDLEANMVGVTITRFETPEQLIDNRITAVRQDLDGFVWVGTAYGLSRLDPRNGALVNFTADPLQPESLPADDVNDLFLDRGGMLWIGTESAGISQYHPSQNRFPKYLYNPLLAQLPPKQRIDGVVEPPRPGLNGVPVTAFYEDVGGRLYIGTAEGLSLLNRAADRFVVAGYHRYLFSRLEGETVTGILEDGDGNLWVGTQNNGLYRTETREPLPNDPQLFTEYLPLDPPPTEIDHYRVRLDRATSLASNNITSLLIDFERNLWVGTSYGLHRYDADLNNGEGGFHRFLPETGTTIRDGDITALARAEPNGVWAGTSSAGLDLIAPDGTWLQSYTHAEGEAGSLSNNAVTCLLLDLDGDLWVGTNGGGINLLRDGRFQHYSNLPDNAVLALQEDERGGIWLSSAAGLARLDKASGEVRVFTVTDGLQSREFTKGSAIRLSDGQLAFGGVRGFNLFNPAVPMIEGLKPPVHLTAVNRFDQQLTFDQPLDDVEEIRVSYKENYISFEFLALDFVNPEANRYAYQMEDIDRGWVDSGTRRFAAYPNLNPGTYTFRVRARGAVGEWNEEGVSIRLVVTPPFWKRIWFVLSILVLAAYLVVLLYRMRVRQLHREKRLQEDFSKQLIQSQEHERRRIAAELHDSLGQNLLVINNEIQHQIQVAEKEGRAHHYDDLSEMILDSIKECRDIAYYLHPHQLERLGLKRAVESVINKVDAVSDVHFVLRNADVDGLFDKDVEINLYRIIQEAINNILKHAEAHEVLVDLKLVDRYLLILIEDDGVGFDPKRLNKGEQGIGLSSMNERIKLIHGSLRISSAPGEGTSLHIRVPLGDGDAASE